MHTHTSFGAAPSPVAISSSRRALLTVVTAGVVLFGAIFGSLAASPAAHAHDELVGYSLLPAATSGNDSSPAGFILNFNNELTQLGAEVIAVDAAGNSIADGLPELAGREMTQRFTPNLEAGIYPISWTVVSSDGHRIAGALTLNVSENKPAELEIGELADFSDSTKASGSSADESAVTTTSETTNENDAPSAGATTAVIIGGIAVFGVVVALFIRKMRQLNTNNSNRPKSGESA